MRKKFQAAIILTISVCLLLVFIPIVIFATYHLVFSEKIYPYISVNNLNLAGKKKNKALKIIDNYLLTIKPSSLRFKLGNKTWEIDLKRIGLEYLSEATVRKAYFLGRSSDFKNNLLTKWTIWRKKRDLGLSFKINAFELNKCIATMSAQIEKPAIPPTIRIVNHKAEIQPGESGKKINRSQLFEILNKRISWVDFSTIEVPVENILPEITLEQAEKTRQRAEKLLSKSLKLSFDKNLWTINDEEAVNLLSFAAGFDEMKIASYAASLAKTIDRPAQNALFNFSGGRVLEFKPAQDGQILNQERTILLIKEALEGLEKEKQNKIASITLPINVTKPLVTTGQVNNLGIKESLGIGESWFWGSAPERIHNINLAANKLNGLLIAPGETFSFNKAIGDISAQTGFKQAYIIKEGRTVLGDGGGVCQVSTTLFRTALSAGLPIEERKSHAYRVSYYEQNYQVGVDATVFDPTADLKIKNDTSAYVLIQSRFDPTMLKLTFELYGTSDGRTATVFQSRIWDQKPPPPDLYQDDPTLPVGVVKQVDWKAWGAKVSFDWKVTRGNEVLQEKTFYSNYRPWQAVFLRGAGGQ